jgi:hypothetical protein
MAQRSLEEVIQTIAPSRQAGIPNPPTIEAGVSSDNGDLTAALSQAGQQIEQLQAAYQQQSNLITENTQALESSTSSHGGSGSSVLGSVTSSLFGGALGFLSPIISGIASLFGGSSTPQALPIYTPPPPVSISGVVQATPAPAQASSATAASSTGAGSQAASSSSSSSSPQITVNVSAMDSQSFIDRSNDIASAVREAMLNMHPINNVVAEL